MKTTALRSLLLLFALALTTLGCPRSRDDNGGAAAPVTIEGERWILSSLQGEPAPEFEEGTPIHFQLDPAENRISGFSGCNSFTGGYTLEDGYRLRFTQMASTRKYCEGRMETELKIIQALAQVAGYALQGETLSLNDAEGVSLLVFRR